MKERKDRWKEKKTGRNERKDRWKEERVDGKMERWKEKKTGRKVGRIGLLGGPVLAHGPHV